MQAIIMLKSSCLSLQPAVIWTDVIQCILMVLGLLMVIICGTIEFGSLTKPFEILNEGNRLVVFK